MGSNEIETLTREMAMKAHELNHQMYVDARKSAIDSANIALKAMLLINGGAVVALLAFLGSTNSSSEGSGYFSALVHPISLFAWGVGFSALTAVLSYLVNMLGSGLIASK